jgi:hypothetical protein
MRRINVAWVGATGLPGVSVFYCPSATDAGADLMTFFGAIKSLIPSVTTITVPTSGDTIDDVTGALTGGWTGGTGGATACTGAGNYFAGVGAYINWQTPLVVGGRRLRGRTFIAPLTVNQSDSNGTLLAAAVTLLQNSATTLAATGHLSIWHRPNPPGSSTGASASVTSALVPDQVTSLRTRRR